MNYLTKILIACIIISNIAGNALAQRVKYHAPEAHTAPVIDGTGDDICWEAAEWAVIDQEWFGKPLLDSTDFYGRYKAVWTPERLYLLVEITDDVLNEDIEDPLDRYWEDDCLEVFIDEDHSGGDHKCCTKAYNAFAYHISPVTKDAVDLSGDGDFVPKLFNDHVDIEVTVNEDLITMEMAIKIYNKNFSERNASNPIETLNKGKLMGFSLAYCDDDGNGRENFIGTQAGGLDSWMNADLFGEMELIANTTSVEDALISETGALLPILYPNPAKDFIVIQSQDNIINYYELTDQLGRVVKYGKLNGSAATVKIDVSEVKTGIYFLKIIQNNNNVTTEIIQVVK